MGREGQIKKGWEMERDWDRRVRDRDTWRDRHTERMTWPERQKKNERPKCRKRTFQGVNRH